ncbi:bifunctional diguanylate cyclase/phosphodiesterase [Acinetobacter sp. CFCC 10889]|uniref:bifunctional diguanylate cyclase/phosphodiesterase n=1 Tax=Acinetobacter sp. CFCC 10889 TaxID=1775557 RepID=UPI000DCF9607|nr:bifunctional diguanylate cyclase/phosphodiesterase [Acinetobacter sp. CFCC 10889]
MAMLDLPHDSPLSQADTPQTTLPVAKTVISDEVKLNLDLLPHLIWIQRGDASYCNNALKDYIGVEHQNIPYCDLTKCVYQEDAEHLYNLWNNAQKTGQKFEKECRIRDNQGHYHWFLLIAQSHSIKPDQFDWTVTCTNIHERAVLLRETADTLRAHTDMLDVSVDCIKIVRPNGTVSHMNRSGCIALLGQEKVKKFDMEWLSLLPPEVRDKGQVAITAAAKGKNARFAGMSGNGDARQYWDNILTPVVNEDGQTTSILCVSRDITLQRIAENKLRISSERDELTGLMNRRSFKQQLKKSLLKAKTNKQKLGLMLIDLDHFKHINDTLGHPAGDHLLRILSKRLNRSCDENTYVARLGGDEFAVVVNNLQDIEHFECAAQTVLKQLDLPITYAGKLINGGMSIGCALYPNDAKDSSNLLKYADTALNNLKDGGRGGVRFFSQEMLEITIQKAAQLETARQIVRDNSIEPYYQPKVNLETGRIISFEALLRWKHPELGIQLPGSVAEAFNDYELATKIAETMHLKIFSDMACWIQCGLDVVPVSINASPVEFMRDNYAEILLKRLEKYQIPYHLVEIEITEHILAERGYIYVARALNKLKQVGVRIALDDFGTGHSSLTHLHDYPVDSLKIDCGFVHRMNSELPIHAIVQGISQLGPILSLDIIAEGIETEEQLESLKQVGCSLGQGFLFSRAIDASNVVEMLSKNHLEIKKD